MSKSPPSGSPSPAEGRGRLGTAGWFGKIPALGDFVSRRLPPQFVEAWDDWLSNGLVTARQAWGPNWPSVYLKSPTWRFALMPGVLDATHWYGILMPSVDRVGREFPLTFATSCEAPPDGLEAWWAKLLGTAMRARDPACGAEAIEADLACEPREKSDAIWTAYEQGLDATLASAARGKSLWWPWCPESSVFGPLLSFKGLPQGSQFLGLIGKADAAGAN